VSTESTAVALCQTLVEWIKAPWRMFTRIFLISTFALFVPKSWLQTIGMTAWVQSHWTWLILASAFSGLFLIITGVEERVKPILAGRRRKRETDEKYSKLKATLKSLRTDEVGILGFYSAGYSTRNFPRVEGVVQNLVNKRILYRSTDEADYVGGVLSHRRCHRLFRDKEPQDRGQGYCEIEARSSLAVRR